MHGGLADQVLGIGELAAVPGPDALGGAERGEGDRLAAPAQLGARLADGGGRRGLIAGDGGQARQVGQVVRNEHDGPNPASAVGGAAQRAAGGGGVTPGGGEAGLGKRAAEFHQPDGAASSRGPVPAPPGMADGCRSAGARSAARYRRMAAHRPLICCRRP
jgi:hypothetical protein